MSLFEKWHLRTVIDQIKEPKEKPEEKPKSTLKSTSKSHKPTPKATLQEILDSAPIIYDYGIVDLMVIYRILTGKNFPRKKGTTKEKIENAIMEILGE